MEWLCVGGLVLGILFWAGTELAAKDSRAVFRDVAAKALDLERENERLRTRLEAIERDFKREREELEAFAERSAKHAYAAGAAHERMRTVGDFDEDAGVTMIDDGSQRRSKR